MKKPNIRVWRSLVSRLNGVQEAAGSNPVTRTKEEVFGLPLSVFMTGGLLLASPSGCRASGERVGPFLP